MFKRINKAAAPVVKSVATTVAPAIYPADDIRVAKKSRKVLYNTTKDI